MLIKNFQKILFQGNSITDLDIIRIDNGLGIEYVSQGHFVIAENWLKIVKAI